MELSQYRQIVNLNKLTELDACKYLVYFHYKYEGNIETDFSTIKDELKSFRGGNINFSRLKSNITKSKLFIKGKSKNSITLNRKYIEIVEKEISELLKNLDNEDTIDENKSIVPSSYFNIKYKYLLKLFKQINCCYENNCFDATALLMRRLMEVLLILNFQYFRIENLILKSSNEVMYKNLSEIIDITRSNAITLHIDKEMSKSLLTFKELGNYAAHKTTYNVHKQAISEQITNYQILIQQLLNNINILGEE